MFPNNSRGQHHQNMLPRRAHTHPGNRPKTTSACLFETSSDASWLIHPPTDPANRPHRLEVVRLGVKQQRLLKNRCASLHAAAAPLVRARPAADGAHFCRHVRPFRRVTYLLWRITPALRAAHTTYAILAGIRYTGYADNLRTDAMHARAKHTRRDAEPS